MFKHLRKFQPLRLQYCPCKQNIFVRNYSSQCSGAAPFLKELNDRGIVFQQTDSLGECLEKKPGVYAGFDPTNDGLHVGNLLVLTTLKRFHKAGFPVVVLVGGATGMIGDPSGRTSERQLLDAQQVNRNVQSIKREIENFIGQGIIEEGKNDSQVAPQNGSPIVTLVNNASWLGEMNIIDFLRNIGKFFHVNNMLRLDSVKSRLEGSSENSDSAGMTFTEFSYSLFQSYDFYHLYKHHGVAVQIGGSDQYGNIVSGLDYLKKKINYERAQVQQLQQQQVVSAGGLTIPLLTTADGKKFGKSEGNALFLSSQKTTVFDFYQYFMRVHDSDAIKFMRMLTFKSLDEIKEIEREHFEKPEARKAQKILAQEMTRAIHGEEELQKVQAASDLLYGNNTAENSTESATTNWTREQINLLLKDAPRGKMSRSQVFSLPLFVVLNKCGMFKSQAEAKRMFKQGGIYINNRREENASTLINSQDAIENQVILFRSGKKNYFVLELLDD